MLWIIFMGLDDCTGHHHPWASFDTFRQPLPMRDSFVQTKTLDLVELKIITKLVMLHCEIFVAFQDCPRPELGNIHTWLGGHVGDKIRSAILSFFSPLNSRTGCVGGRASDDNDYLRCETDRNRISD